MEMAGLNRRVRGNRHLHLIYRNGHLLKLFDRQYETYPYFVKMDPVQLSQRLTK